MCYMNCRSVVCSFTRYGMRVCVPSNGLTARVLITGRPVDRTGHVGGIDEPTGSPSKGHNNWMSV